MNDVKWDEYPQEKSLTSKIFDELKNIVIYTFLFVLSILIVVGIGAILWWPLVHFGFIK